MLTITEGDKQPIECKKCKKFMGYKIIHTLKKYFEQVYTDIGALNGGVYSEYEKTIHINKIPVCANCNHKLTFEVLSKIQTKGGLQN